MHQRVKVIARSRTIWWMGVLGVVVALVGFAKTFFLPLLTGSFRASPVVYLHALILFGWVGFFLFQSSLVHARKLRLHKQLGRLGAVLASGVVLSTLAVGTLASRRTATDGAPDQANGELLVIMIEMLLFSGLVSAAIFYRKRPETHRRLMLLALIGSLGPAWFRFRHYFPEVGNPVFLYSILIADSLVLAAVLSDLMRGRGLHPVYCLVGSGMVAVHLVEVFAFGSAPFQAAANAIAGPLI